MHDIIWKLRTASCSYRDENNKLKTKALNTDSEQIANRKLEEFEKFGLAAILKAGGVSGAAGVSAETETPLVTALDGFIAHIKTHFSSDNAVKNVPVLRSIFGEICPGLQYSRHGSGKKVIPERR